LQPHLLVDISSHGYGHLAQTAPVLNELAGRMPRLRLTLRCALPREVLARRILPPFEHIPESFDFGMVMRNAVDLDLEASAARYADAHRDWEAKVAREARRLREINPDLLLSNVPYLPLAAAQRAGVPAVAMSSLNWAAILLGTLDAMPGAAEIHAQILAAYRGAAAFLRITPAMPMEDLDNTRTLGPVATLRRPRREELRRRLGLEPDSRLVMVALGGIPMRLPVERWPQFPGLRWLVPGDWGATRPDVLPLDAAGLSFADTFVSCDAVIAKPGYGTFVDAACNGLPVLYLRRPGWPEEACLLEWLAEYGVAAEVARGALENGDFAEELMRLLDQPRPPPARATGAYEAAALLAGMLEPA
jgi:peptidoglycan/xylan/chitin deacetylase (PgdA/CDA1 family)